MRVFVDCEFTDFIGCDLISIGLVADDGCEFYGERSDYDHAACSAFVREAVLPQLGQYPSRVFTREGLRVSLLAWLDQFAGEPERALCVDYAGDWDLLIDLLGEVPEGWVGLHVGSLVDHGRLEAYFAEHEGRHHALVDARANRFAIVSGGKDSAPAVPMAQMKSPRIF
ncbi:3'-5' exoribonuclease [Paraburkholderia sp. J10-1]|uniref:3'-5' exoribonuclease n=1 Tax=Paraburkholderia sp. J10-1 TaxID=2805430 RepID=UPI002AB67590|nr:3'-5' exoribonuclease [Paraburkholderia sp. J10-1]